MMTILAVFPPLLWGLLAYISYISGNIEFGIGFMALHLLAVSNNQRNPRLG